LEDSQRMHILKEINSRRGQKDSKRDSERYVDVDRKLMAFVGGKARRIDRKL